MFNHFLFPIISGSNFFLKSIHGHYFLPSILAAKPSASDLEFGLEKISGLYSVYVVLHLKILQIYPTCNSTHGTSRLKQNRIRMSSCRRPPCVVAILHHLTAEIGDGGGGGVRWRRRQMAVKWSHSHSSPSLPPSLQRS